MTEGYLGTIRMYRADRGFGFIIADDTKLGDVFFHISGCSEYWDTAIPCSGDRVVFDLERYKKGALDAVRAVCIVPANIGDE